MQKVAKPGEWESPISAEMLAEYGNAIGWIQIVGADLWWDEMRPSDGARTVVVSRLHGDILPAPWSAHSQVHEYGGLSWLGFIREKKPMLAFINGSDQRIYLTAPQGKPWAITPEPPKGEIHRYIEMIAVGNELWCIREIHRMKEVTRDLVAVTESEIRSLESSSHFYSHPRISPDGKRLAWIAWEHPQMPWDGTELRVAEIEKGQLANVRTLAGSGEISCMSLEWGNGATIYYICDKSGWWNPWQVDLDGLQNQIIEEESEWGAPEWRLGLQFIAILPDGKLLCQHGPVAARKVTLVDPKRKVFADLDSELNNFKATLSINANHGYAVGASDTTIQQLIEFDLTELKVTEVIRTTHPPFESRYLTKPYELVTRGQMGRTIHAIVHPAHNPDYDKPDMTPLLVMVHGGPTDQANASMSLLFNYFTSRGISVVDVNYAGSSGYGRAYRNSLRGQWGVFDHEDVTSIAQAFVENGLVGKEEIVISGGSAGGFTVLNALLHSPLFAAGAAYYGIVDLTAFMAGTHDFESRYLDSLIGIYPAKAALFKTRSPLTYVDRLATPLILFHGLKDNVVPSAQSEALRDACVKKGVKHEYLTFEDEGHNFFKAESIIASVKAELKFYGEVLGFQPHL
jgi:dipeptidyl aminopeptidase/acylaminoacyl peptidase